MEEIDPPVPSEEVTPPTRVRSQSPATYAPPYAPPSMYMPSTPGFGPTFGLWPASGFGPAFTTLGFGPASGSDPAFTTSGFGPTFRLFGPASTASGFGPAFTALGFGPTFGLWPCIGLQPRISCIGLRPLIGLSSCISASGFDLAFLALGFGPAWTAFGLRPSIYCFRASAPHLQLSDFGTAFTAFGLRPRIYCFQGTRLLEPSLGRPQLRSNHSRVLMTRFSEINVVHIDFSSVHHPRGTYCKEQQEMIRDIGPGVYHGPLQQMKTGASPFNIRTGAT
ncbi:hypothetical protein CRG98_017725 [Punica granatum]|uniref:Uncharacterized protein n=1 Tax=Punica granatum TaxID=22663 RepID=A0A2I0K2H4_PUNGR|nr:hypothetical protein CRG98_017725 [Punica granatum]